MLEGITRWFFRWIFWIYFAWRQVVDINPSTRATSFYLVPLAVGTTAILCGALSLFIPVVEKLEWWIQLIIVAGCFLFYLLVGLTLFFNKDLKLSNTLPWYDNGAW